jgi:UDP-N-acetylmuramate dehydrogenase
MKEFETLAQDLNAKIKYNAPLAPYTAARLGGAADTLCIASSTDVLIEAARIAHHAQMPWIILGGGANVLVSDNGFEGLVILNKTNTSSIDDTTGLVEAESGVSLITLARRCMKRGLKGLEWCVSVPGTLGGAVVNNAGAHGDDMTSSVLRVAIFDLAKDQLVSWGLEQLDYDYRHSSLKGHHGQYIITATTLQLDAGHTPADLQAIADGFIAHRKRTQPPGASMGSVFKNPSGDYAGRLIEAAGLKGHRIGGVQVSPVHANFFVNDDSATATDYNALIEHVQHVVHEQFEVALVLEIERLGVGFES